MPTLMPSAPASTSAFAPSAVTMLPAMSWSCGCALRMRSTVAITPREWPCEVSTMTTSTPAAASSATRSSVSGAVPTAAPTRRRPCSSLQARGKSRAFWMSLTVIMPRSRPSASTTSTFSMRCRCRSSSTSSRGAFSRTVTSFSRGVMTFDTGRSSCSSKRMSRWVTMPTTWLPSVGHRQARDAPGAGQGDDLADRRVRAHGDRVLDDAALVLLDAPDLARLVGGGHVLVDDAEPAFLGDGDREAGLGDRVHRRGHERQVEADAAGEARRQVDLAGQHVRVRRDEQDVVEGECFLDDAHFRHTPGRSE